MACLELKITHVPTAELAVEDALEVSLYVLPEDAPLITATPLAQTEVKATPLLSQVGIDIITPEQAHLNVTPCTDEQSSESNIKFAVSYFAQATMALHTGRKPSLAVTPQTSRISMSATPVQRAAFNIASVQPVIFLCSSVPKTAFVLAEVCSTAGEELFPLATAEGPLRLQGGGFLLLDPALSGDE